MEMFSKSPRRDTTLHCQVQGVNKEWVLKVSEELNRSIGALVDEMLTEKREAMKKASSNKKSGR